MMGSPNNGAGVGGSGSEEDDKCVPRAAVYKMIKDCTPQIRVSGEAKEFFVQCCNEFIHRLSLQANGVCEQQAKKLIHPDHIVTGQFFFFFSLLNDDGSFQRWTIWVSRRTRVNV